MKKRINIQLEENLLDKVDAYADEMSINRTSAIVIMINNYFNGMDSLNTLKQFMTLYEEKNNNIKKGEII